MCGASVAPQRDVSRNLLLPVLLVVACTGRDELPAPGAAERIGPTAQIPKPDAPQAPIRTDRPWYVLTEGPRVPEATIIATLTAPADQTLYILNCNGASSATLQRRVNDEWVFAWVVAMNACLSPPIIVPPGEEHTASIYVHEHSGGVLQPRGARMIESGTYRVAWTGVLTSFEADEGGFGPELPLEQRVSAPFTIEVPE